MNFYDIIQQVIDMEKRKTKKDIVKMLLRNNELDERDEEELWQEESC